MLVISQVPGHLLNQGSLQHRLGDLGLQAVQTQQLNPPQPPVQQPICQFLMDRLPRSRRPVSLIVGHYCSVFHSAPFREPPFLRLIVRPCHLRSR